MTQGGRRLRYTQQCNFCNYKFASEHDLIVHQLTHSEKHFSCDRCLAVFSKESLYERHRTVCQGGKKPHVCNDCGDVFKTGQQLDEHHRRVHQSSKIYECSSCSAKFAWHDNLLRHERMHRAESCVCKICGALFGSSASVKVHLWKAHNEVLKEETEQAKTFVCNFCKKSFRFAKNLKMHACVGESRPDAKTSDEKPYNCDVCNKSFKYDFSYDAHMRTHGEPSDVRKTITVNKGASAADMAMLFDSKDPERPHKCGVCGIGFKYDFSLMAHMKSHTDQEVKQAINGAAPEVSGPITMVQFAEMIQNGLANDSDQGNGTICIEAVNDHDAGALSVEMYDFPDQEVTMLPVSHLPSGLLNLLFQQPSECVSTSAGGSSSLSPEKLQPAVSASGIVPLSELAASSSSGGSGGGFVEMHAGSSGSHSPSTSLAVDSVESDKHQEQDKDQIYTIHSVILDGMRMTTNPDESCLEEL